MKRIGIISLLFLFLCSCSAIRNTAKQELSDGFYNKKENSEKSRVYVHIADENIYTYKTIEKKTIEIDTTQAYSVYFSELNTLGKNNFKLSQNSFDLDFFTIPLKLRFTQKDVPTQLNANINGAVYIGYRIDRYKINYRGTPMKKAVRHVDHFGYSVGFFTGLGNTFISPTNTHNVLQQEYDGIVWSKGIAGIVAINSFSVGITLGFDNLLDRNKKIWIYENKPWLGLAFGLNLN